MLDVCNFRKTTLIQGSYARFNRDVYPVKILTNLVLDILPNFSIRRKLDFTELTDKRSIDLLEKAETYSTVLFFYSGGIDSTTLLCAILKNWPKADLARVTIVMNQHSINENQLMFDRYIKGNFIIENVDEFFTSAKVNNDTLYITGMLGDALMAEENNTMMYDQQYPNTYHKPWREHKDNLINFYTTRTNAVAAHHIVESVEQSLALLNYEVETIYDFFWWISFNWGWDTEIFYSVWFWKLSATANTKQFLEENNFLWFNTVDYQDWAINTIGTTLMSGDSLKMAKYSMKKYIYDFNHDSEYFLNKIKEGSVSKNKELIPIRFCGIDDNYNIYYRKLNTNTK